MTRRAGAVIGAVLAVVALGFCVRALAREWARVESALADAAWGWLLVGLLFAAFAMTLIALRWRACIVALGGNAPGPGRVVRWYYAGELGKYLPGGVWPIVGRGELAASGDLSRTIAYGSVALSLAALYGAAVLPLGILLLHPAVVDRVRRLLSKLTRRQLELLVPPLPVVVRLLLSYLPVWIAISACTVAVAEGLDVGGSWWRLAAATVLAWCAGFAAVPVPAGAGVREVVFVAASGIAPGLAAAVAITCRICFVLVDGTGGALSAASLGLTRRRRVAGSDPETDAAT